MTFPTCGICGKDHPLGICPEIGYIGYMDVEGLRDLVEEVRRREKTPIKIGRGRPSTGFNKTAYMKEYMRQRRAKEKEERNDHRTSHHGNDSDTELRGDTGNR